MSLRNQEIGIAGFVNSIQKEEPSPGSHESISFKVKYFFKKCDVEEKHHHRLVQHVMANHQTDQETTSDKQADVFAKFCTVVLSLTLN